MKVKHRGVASGRMTPAIIDAVLHEIAAYERGERDTPLSWRALVAFSGFSTVSLWSKEPIKQLFRRVKDQLADRSTRPVKRPRTIDERISRMQLVVDELRETVRAYDELWALFEYNIQRIGLSSEELRRPLDPTSRQAVKSRKRS